MRLMHSLQTQGLNPNADWNTIRGIVREKMDAVAFDSWIAPLSGFTDGNILNLVAPNQFSIDFIKRTYMHFLADAAGEFGMTVSFGLGRAGGTPQKSFVNDNAPKNDFKIPTNAQRPMPSDQKITFDDFIISEQNAFAVTACRKLAESSVSFSPLFLYGASGSGKSMLARATAGAARGRVVFMTGAQFVSEFLRAMSERAVFAFKDFVRNCDTFILDDVQQIAGKRACSEEFMTTILDLIRDGKNVVLTAGASPAAISGFERRLQSILASGLSVDLTAPDKFVRRAMLMRAGIPADLSENVAGRIPADGHIVAGLSKKIRAFSELMNSPVTLEIAERLLADSIGVQKTPLMMVKNMAAKLGVSMDDVASTSRLRAHVRARQIMMAALKHATKLSLSDIGQLIGGRDHATVLYALGQIEKLKSSDLMLAAEIEQMVAECK